MLDFILLFGCVMSVAALLVLFSYAGTRLILIVLEITGYMIGLAGLVFLFYFCAKNIDLERMQNSVPEDMVPMFMEQIKLMTSVFGGLIDQVENVSWLMSRTLNMRS